MSRVIVKDKKLVLKANHFNVYETKVEFGGKEHIFHHVDKKAGAYVVVLSDTNDVILEKHYRHSYSKEFIEIVAGVIEDNEDPLEAAKRELKEETGITAQSWQLLSVTESASDSTMSKKYYYLARDLHEGKQHLEESEDITLIKMPIDEAVDKILNNEINAEKTVVGILLVYTLLKQGRI